MLENRKKKGKGKTSAGIGIGNFICNALRL